MTGRALRRGNWSVQELQRLRHLLPRRGVADTAALLRRTPDSVRRRAVELFAGPPRRASWSLDDQLTLRRSWGALEARLIAVMLGRPVADVRRCALALQKARRSGPWSRGEERMLKEVYGTRTDADLEVCMQRSASDIAEAARRLCLSKDKRFAKGVGRTAATAGPRMPRWTDAEIEQLVSLYADRENLEVARRLGRSVASVANKAWQLGLKKSPGLLERIGRTNIAARYAADAGRD